jgi:hypothetical protein
VPEPLRVMILGTGQMGCGIARLVLQKKGLALVGAYARRAVRSGRDLGRIAGLERDLGISVGNDLEEVLRSCRPQVAIQATCSRLEDALPEIGALVEQGVDVISIAEQMAWPAASSLQSARELHRLAVDHGASVLGTGINPGFVLDLLIIALSGVCAEVRAISATRVNDLSPYGPSVLSTQGVGLSPEQFRRGLEAGTVVGHFGFAESIQMMACALGWELDRIEEQRDPILSSVERQTPFVRVEPGQVAGCHHRAVAYRDGVPVITLDHPQQVLPEAEGVATGDRIEITGTPDVRLSGSPEIPGGQGTVALAVNSIPRVRSAAPGLYSMADLPVPAALADGPGEPPWRSP